MTAPLLRTRDVDWEIVDSSNVHSALYDFEELQMFVRFLRSGPDDIYRYFMVPPQEWDDFLSAPSKGIWIWDNPIEENWRYELLTQRDWWRADTESVHPDVHRFAIKRGPP